ncbi:UbiA family prenyltransferase [Henriciella sp.]|uniref:UbiA family prenyltransferase n=1 Tax=Henriciella sp. TaxID=1968823 RepID=UPI000C0DD031|nr:UbiA family prenyltransferase [Henriciella sp.]PHR70339.1 MAG: hypothetical protein COA64_16070 [Henriciella sp.]
MKTSCEKPLIVDLDGTLIRNDLSHELFVLILRWKPWLIPLTLIKFLSSRSEAKAWMTEQVGHHIDPAHLPYEKEVLALIEAHCADGGSVELVSGSNHVLVERISSHIGTFASARGSQGKTNLVSSHKARYLTERHAEGFFYVGNSGHDIQVWSASAGGFGVRAPETAYDLKNENGDAVVKKTIHKTRSAKPLLKQLRLHQWAKNILIFTIPGLVMPQLSIANWLALVQGFICFGLMASGTYILNDLFDIPDDRAHSTKRNRPLASGRLSVPMAGGFMLLFIFGSIAWATIIDLHFLAVLLLYAATTILYSFRLKRVAILDVFVLAGLFSLRVLAGSEIIGVPPSSWLMTFIGLVFLSLALAKRYVEVSKAASSSRIAGRGYVSDDAPMLLAFGAAAGLCAVLSLAIYGLLAPNRLIDNALILFAVVTIMASWTMRIWLVAARGELDDDPVLYAVKDRISLTCLVAVAGLFSYEVLRPVWPTLF